MWHKVSSLVYRVAALMLVASLVDLALCKEGLEIEDGDTITSAQEPVDPDAQYREDIEKAQAKAWAEKREEAYSKEKEAMRAKEKAKEKEKEAVKAKEKAKEESMEKAKTATEEHMGEGPGVRHVYDARGQLGRVEESVISHEEAEEWMKDDAKESLQKVARDHPPTSKEPPPKEKDPTPSSKDPPQHGQDPAKMAKPLLTQQDFKKMRVKQLRTFLSTRGITCKGCAEKDDFVKMAMESRELKTTDEKEDENNADNDITSSMYNNGPAGSSDTNELVQKISNTKNPDDAFPDFSKGLPESERRRIEKETKESVQKNFPDDKAYHRKLEEEELARQQKTEL